MSTNGLDRPQSKRYSGHCKNWHQSLADKGLEPKIEVVQELQDDGLDARQELSQLEIHWIAVYRAFGCRLTNLTDGGEGQLNPSEETRQKLCAARKRRAPASEETKKKIGDAMRGRPLSEEHKKKIAAAKRGHRHSDEFKKKISESLIGNKRHLGHRHSVETRRKMSEAHRYTSWEEAFYRGTSQDE